MPRNHDSRTRRVNDLDIHLCTVVYELAGNFGVELALNLVWLGLAAAALLRWGVFALMFPNRRTFAAGIAIVCVIVFLFPVISASDDLHNSPAVCETSKLKKWVSADLDEALLSSAIAPLPRQVESRRNANLDAEVHLPSRDVVWSALDRRPPPV